MRDDDFSVILHNDTQFLGIVRTYICSFLFNESIIKTNYRYRTTHVVSQLSSDHPRGLDKPNMGKLFTLVNLTSSVLLNGFWSEAYTQSWPGPRVRSGVSRATPPALQYGGVDSLVTEDDIGKRDGTQQVGVRCDDRGKDVAYHYGLSETGMRLPTPC